MNKEKKTIEDILENIYQRNPFFRSYMAMDTLISEAKAELIELFERRCKECPHQ